jgi:hypothetical protein
VKEKNGRELRKMEREENRKNNKFYQELRNDIKYGIDEGEYNEKEEVQGNQKRLGKKEGGKESIEVELNGEKKKEH